MEGREIGLWNQIVLPSNLSLQEENIFKGVFPSGRQALSFGLKQCGLSRHERVAIPEWTTNCITNALSKVAMVIPLKECVKYAIPVKAVVLYEQWGWAFEDEIKDEILKAVDTSIIILDRVDSADIYNPKALSFMPKKQQIELYSLSKVLGTKGGGLVRVNGVDMNFERDEVQQEFINFLGEKVLDTRILDPLLHICKSEVVGLHPELLGYLQDKDVFKLYEEEAGIRRKNVETLLCSRLSRNWGGWMRSGFDRGGAPGIAPIFVGEKESAISEVVDYLRGEFHIKTALYNFNICGNPVAPEYVRCIALPLHSGVLGFEEMVTRLEEKF